MKAEIISIGTEILLGNIIDTNSQYIACELATYGIDLYHITAVGDNKIRIISALDNALSRADFIILTGGIGPTIDDISKEAASEYLGLDMVLDSESLINIENIFKNLGKEMPEINKKQAYFPKDSIILKNTIGTAPGCIIKINSKYIALLPGVPKEMELMFNIHIIPYLSQFSKNTILSKIIKLYGIGESDMESKISSILKNQNDVTIAPYSSKSAGEAIIRLTAKSRNKDSANLLINKQYNNIYDNLKDYIYGFDSDTLPSVVIKKMIERNLKISIAESFTGGGFARAIVEIPSASYVLLESIVSYSNESKIKNFGISIQNLEKYGAVSRQIAIDMAYGALKKSKSDISISFTGIAGPDGATNSKPVGLCYIGICYKNESFSYKYNFNGTREYIMNRAINEGFFLLLSILKGEKYNE